MTFLRANYPVVTTSSASRTVHYRPAWRNHNHFATVVCWPKDQVALADIAENLDLVIDYGWLWWLAPLFCHYVHPNLCRELGVAIIILTICGETPSSDCLLRVKSMAKMRTVQPKIETFEISTRTIKQTTASDDGALEERED